MPILEIAQHLGEAEHAHRQHGEVDAVGERREAEGHALLAGLEVGADGREQQAQHDHAEGLQDRAARQHDREAQTHHHQRKILGRAEQQRELGQRRAERGDDDGGNAAGEEGAERRRAERDAGAALLGHLVAVQRGDDRGRLAGDVHQDGRRRAAVLGAVIDAGEHDQRAHRIEPEGDRQQDGDGRDRADARQHADQRADETAGEAQGDVLQ
jgi:hypothetical protein